MSVQSETQGVPVRRGRGRPRKNPLPVVPETTQPNTLEAAIEAVNSEIAELGTVDEQSVFPEVGTLPDPFNTSEFDNLLGELTGAVDPTSLASSLGAPVGAVDLGSKPISITIDNHIAKIEMSPDEANLAEQATYVTVDTLTEALSSNIKKGGQATVFPVGIRVLCESQDKVLVGFEAPERVANIAYDGGMFPKFKAICVVPHGMTFILFNKQPDGSMVIKEFYQLATKGPVFDGDDMLYFYPGTNIWDDCRVCIGSIKRNGYRDIHTLGSLQYLFYNGINNDDLHGGKLAVDKLVEAYPEAKTLECYDKCVSSTHPYILWKTMEVTEKNPPKPFPYACLKQKLTLKDFLACLGFKLK